MVRVRGRGRFRLCDLIRVKGMIMLWLWIWLRIRSVVRVEYRAAIRVSQIQKGERWAKEVSPS